MAQIVFQNKCTTGSICKIKDHLTLGARSWIMYESPCDKFEEKYNDETIKALREKQKENFNTLIRMQAWFEVEVYTF